MHKLQRAIAGFRWTGRCPDTAPPSIADRDSTRPWHSGRRSRAPCPTGSARARTAHAPSIAETSWDSPATLRAAARRDRSHRLGRGFLGNVLRQLEIHAQAVSNADPDPGAEAGGDLAFHSADGILGHLYGMLNRLFLDLVAQNIPRLGGFFARDLHL